MCGITGIISKSPSGHIGAMMQSIAHRGPDDEGTYEDDRVVFGHLRLAIQDLSPTGHQPMVSNDGRYILVMNGEIYNHREIRESLIPKYSFKSSGDTETVLYGFAEYGVALFAQLNGIFAMAIYDKEKEKVYLVRDQFGLKPLYYVMQDSEVIFASEIKALVKFPDFDKQLSNEALANYLYFLWSPGELTPFEACKKLPAGHFMEISTNETFQSEMFCYYELPFNGIYDQKTEEQWIDELDIHLTRAVERQLLSDVPLGFFLSGGLDSSLIVAIAKKLMPNQVIKCYTIDAKISSGVEGFADDLPYAKKVAAHLGVDLEIVNADIDILRDFDKMIYHLDEPQADAAPLNVMNICEKARKDGIIVLLGGTAGDDLFSGYRRHQAIVWYNKLRWIPQFVKKGIYSFSTLFLNKHPFFRRARKLFSLYSENSTDRQFASLYGWLNSGTVADLFQKKIDYDPITFLTNSLNNIPKENALLNKLLYWDMKYFLTDHNLNYTDKMSMAHGIEVRVPFLDTELVAFSTTIPPELKLKGTETKYLLKKVAERYLPKDVIYRPKSGFGAPVREWILNNLKDRIATDLSKENLLPLFNHKKVWQLIEDNRTGKIDASYSIWALLAIHSWHKQFVQNTNDVRGRNY